MSGFALPLNAYRPDPNDPIRAAQASTSLAGMLQQQRIQQQMAPGQMQLQQQAIQAGQQEQQLRQFAIQDANAGQKALQSWDGKDPDQLPDLIRQNGGSYQAVMGARQSILGMKTAAQKLQTDQLDNLGKTNDIIAGHFESVKGAQDKPAAFDAAVSDLEQKGLIQPGQIPHQYPGDDQLNLLEKQFMTQKSIVDQEQKNREAATKETEAQAKATEAETGKQRLQWEQQTGGTNVERAEMNDWLQKNPGKGPSDFAAFKADQTAQAQLRELRLLGGGGGPAPPGTPGGPGGPDLTNAQKQAKNVGLDLDALDRSAALYNQTAQLPPMGRGGAIGIAQNRAIMNRAAELAKENPDIYDLGSNKAAYNANVQSLGSLQKQFDAVSGFENTALKNIDRLIQTASKIPDLGTRFANVPVRALTSNMIGTQNMAALNADLLTAQTEAAKVLSSATGAGVLTNEAREEAQHILNGDMTFPAMVAAAGELKNDMGNRHQSYQQQINDIQGRIGRKPAQQAPPEQQKSTMITMKAPNGQTKQVPAEQVDHYKSLGATVVGSAF